MSDISQTIPNLSQIKQFLEGLDEEFDMDNRLKRYQSMTPELITLAAKHGLPDADQASQALFIADFVITSSEVPPEIADDERRISIIKSFLSGLEHKTDNSSLLLHMFYLAQKVFIALKRNDSFLAGRGIEPESRKIILLDMFVHPFLVTTTNLVETNQVNWELGLLNAILNQQLPDTVIQHYLDKPAIELDGNTLFGEMWLIINEFITKHNAELNKDSPLPNISETGVIFQSTSNLMSLATSNVNQEATYESIEHNLELQSFLNKTDEDHALIYLRGNLVDRNDHLMLARNPFVAGKPQVIFRSPLSDLNVTELVDLLAIRARQVDGLIHTKLIQPINETFIKKKTKQVTEVEQVEVQVEVDPEKSPDSAPQQTKETKKKRGFFSRLKAMIFGSSDNKTDKSPNYETRTVTKLVDQEITREVVEKIEQKELRGYSLPDSLAYSLGIYALEDLRLFEEFDTLREAEYQIIGVLESNFTDNSTKLMSTPMLANSDDIFRMLNGLDEVIEAVINYYYDDQFQLMPEEMLFINKDGDHFILCLAGNDTSLVATIAKSYKKEITDWQEKDTVELVQRRTLHMRTGQLFSARQHTPFDQASKRIYGNALGQETDINELNKAILSVID